MVSARRGIGKKEAITVLMFAFLLFDAITTHMADTGFVGKGILSGGTVARQALTGSVWYAPLPLMVQAIFPLSVQSVGAMSCFFVLLSLYSWVKNRCVSRFIFLSFALSALVLCGLPYLGWVVSILALVAIDILSDPGLRSRFTGLMFLCLTPSIYVLGCWILLSYLVFADPVYAWRSVLYLVSSFKFVLNVPHLIAVAVMLVFAVVFSVFRKRALSVICVALLLLSGWIYVLVSAGLGWMAPGSFRCRMAVAPDMPSICQYVADKTPYGRIFVCGYDGIAASRGKYEVPVEPCLDLHLGELRNAYRKQQLFILVPEPKFENALESCVWRYGDVYSNGAQRLLFAEDFGSWRLYEVISSEM